jgi:hypothetical protein
MERSQIGLVLKIVGIMLIVLSLGSCDATLTAPPGPLLYLDIADFGRDSGSMELTQVAIQRTSGTAALVSIADRLTLYTESDKKDNRGGYTFYLETGATYSQVKYLVKGEPRTVPAVISNAKSGKVYVVRIYY